MMKQRSGLSRYFPEGIYLFEEKSIPDYNRFDTFVGKVWHKLDCARHPGEHVVNFFRGLDSGDNSENLRIDEFDFVERVFQFRRSIAQAIHDYTHIPDFEGICGSRTLRTSSQDEGAEHEARNVRALSQIRGLATLPGEEL